MLEEAFASYLDYIDDAEIRDVKTLKMRLAELKNLRKHLPFDMQQAEDLQKLVISQRVKV